MYWSLLLIIKSKENVYIYVSYPFHLNIYVYIDGRGKIFVP